MKPHESVRATNSAEEDDWLKASEARYDSMKTLLQSVRNDIDALTTRIDQTSQSPCSQVRVMRDEDVALNIGHTNTDVVYRDPAPSNRHNELVDDEYMEIKIRDSENPFSFTDNEGQLLDCAIVDSPIEAGIDLLNQSQAKSWRSPSDFRDHDPFKIDIITENSHNHSTHNIKDAKETDLDDLSSGPYEKDDESGGSISPAVSPTFENYSVETVNLNNMIVVDDGEGHFKFESDPDTKRMNTPEVFELYDDGHALTTIDEASEENEEDWSSSELDNSTTNSEHGKPTVVLPPNHVNRISNNRSIEVDFKSSAQSTLQPLTIHTDEREMYSNDRDRFSAGSSLVEPDHTFIYDPTSIRTTDPSHFVLIRPKPPNIDRPLSTGSLRSNPKESVPGSVHSVLAAFSQESMISEADSYLTVASRLNTTGSEDVYTTACSDSELPMFIKPDYILRGDDDDCATLSRKRTKLSRTQRHRPKDLLSHENASSSDEDLRQKTLIHTPDPVVVTPTFSCLPVKIASPGDDAEVVSHLPSAHTLPYPSTDNMSPASVRQRKVVVQYRKKDTPRRARNLSSGERKSTGSDVEKSSDPSSSPEEASQTLSTCVVERGLVKEHCKSDVHKSEPVCNDHPGELSIINRDKNNSSPSAKHTDEKRLLLNQSQIETNRNPEEFKVVIPKYIYVRESASKTTALTTNPSIDADGAALHCSAIPLVETKQPIAQATEDQTRIGPAKVTNNHPPIPPYATKYSDTGVLEKIAASHDSVAIASDHVLEDPTQGGNMMHRTDANLYDNDAEYYGRNLYTQSKHNPAVSNHLSTGQGNRNNLPNASNTFSAPTWRTPNQNQTHADYDIVQRLRAHDTHDVQVLSGPGPSECQHAYRLSKSEQEPSRLSHSDQDYQLTGSRNNRDHNGQQLSQVSPQTQSFYPTTYEEMTSSVANNTSYEAPNDRGSTKFAKSSKSDFLASSSYRQHPQREQHMESAEYEPVLRADGSSNFPGQQSDVTHWKSKSQASVHLISAPQSHGILTESDANHSKPSMNDNKPVHPIIDSNDTSPETAETGLGQTSSAPMASSSSLPRRPYSPSPTRPEPHRSTGRAPSPVVRPKWHLKTIPTDTEIRERLRSRSRSKMEERQSRPEKTTSSSLYRPRSSRSDSRYRCTDLDSAIAESRTETVETLPPSVQESEMLSETKQSASLFDLNAQFDSIRRNMMLSKQKSVNEHTLSPSRKTFGDTKSYNSLLETDIDTGENFERPIVLETDVDNLEDTTQAQKARSLFNLTSSYTPSTYRRQTAPNTAIEVQNNWERTKSLQGISSSLDNRAGNQGEYTCYSKCSASGTKSLIDRLRDRARSTHELRIAQSLTKLKVPEWLDKAQCLRHSTAENATKPKEEAYVPKYRLFNLSKTSSTRESTFDRSKTSVSSLRSLTGARKTGESLTSSWLPKSLTTNIATVAEPNRPRTLSSHQPNFVRPSQEFRQRGNSLSRLRPIESKLYSSMRSRAIPCANGENLVEARSVAPRMCTTTQGQSVELKLSPGDFVPRNDFLQRLSGARNSTRDHQSIENIAQAEKTSQSTGPSVDPKANNAELPKSKIKIDQKVQIARYEDIKPVDYDSGTENSGERDMKSVRPSETNGGRLLQPAVQDLRSGERNYEEKQVITRKPPVPDQHDQGLSTQSEINSPKREPDWHSIDADGETESEATDGLDQITDLTCLTSLVDTCASRHRALLNNRPSALDHLLTSLGWWPASVRAEHQYYPPTAAEAISIAAHEFDVDEDSHRTEFLELLSGPESRRPVNLGEFALNHLSASVQRKKEDGLLYISCGRSECTKHPIRVDHALNWCACANCYTLYCSPTCRSMDRRNFHDHPTVCSFARAKRVCNRLLRSLSTEQLTGLTALAKTGLARLGRGGILLSFALIKHAEVFLQRSRSQLHMHTRTSDSDLSQQAMSCWENQHQPSPGGMMCPPLYLTLNELEELDSTVAIPCKNYTPTTSMVVIVVVCAYELIARSDGRPVHLFKQSMIIPFPVHTPSNGTSSRSSTQSKPEPVNSNFPQANGQTEKQTKATREAYMIRLQRILRERGVSLRHHYPDIYTIIANFVETGVPFTQIQLVFHDFVLREEVLCTIQPLLDPIIQPTRSLSTNSSGPDRPTPRNAEGLNGLGLRETQF